LWFLFSSGALLASPEDSDNDGLRDAVETHTGVYISPADTGTNPNLADSDGDSLPDGMEVNLGTNPVNAASKVKRPNLIYILADDLGYGDIGCFWQNQRPAGLAKFATPGLDAMAAQGAMLTHHYVGAPICASSRSSFLQGRHQGHADIRDAQFDKPLPDNHTLAGTLKSAGYKTVHIGKAGLSGPDPNLPSAHPLTRGFDRFFGTLTHSQAHEHYPRNGTTAKQAKISDDFGFITDAHQDLYTQDVYTAFAKKTIIEETTLHPERPFFIYLSLDTPHFVGQFPPTRDYPSGKGVSGGLQWTGSPSYVNTATNDPAKVDNVLNRHPDVPSTWYPGAQKFVTMMRRMDDSVADILQTLRDLGIDDDTMVVFTTDNGPDGTEIDPRSFESYGPFEGSKFDLWEGGIRVPTIAWWPGSISGTNQLENIRKIEVPCANYDWLPTFASLAKAPTPSRSDGSSLASALTTGGVRSGEYLYFEMSFAYTTAPFPEFTNHGGETRGIMQAIRIGNLKGVRYNTLSSEDPFRIYDVTIDPKESLNLAPSRPDLQARMKDLAISARRAGGGTSRPYDTALIPAVTPSPVKGGLDWKSYEGFWPWLPEFRDLVPVSSGQAADISPSFKSRDSDVGLSFEGYLSVPTSGAYTFQSTSNAATSLWIHDGHVIDNDYNFTATKTSDPVYLSAGLHPIRLYYRHQGGTASLELKYSGPGIAMQKIPASNLFSDGPPPVFNLQPDSCLTKRNQPVLVDALANDACNYPLSLVSAGGTNSGTASISAGKILYTPASGFFGSATFPYTVLGGAATATSSVTANVLFDNETWIPMNEGGGTTVQAIRETSGDTGTLGGTADPTGSWIPGKYGSCLSFDGIDDQVTFPGMALPSGSSPRTFAFWVRTSATATSDYQTLFSHGGNSTTGQRFTIRLDNVPNTTNPHRLRLEVSGGSIVGTQPVNDGLWHHVALVLSDRNQNGALNIDETLLYVDGVPDPIRSVTPKNISITPGFTPTLGGSSHAANYNFTGDIDDVRIFPRALSAEEIQSLGAPASIIPPGDSDGDGASNLQESIAGTDPEDPGSCFRIHTISRNGSGMTLQWAGVAGRTYRVEESSDLATWTLVPGVAPVVVTSPTSNSSVTVPPNGGAKRFLRMQVMVSP